jgi:hypothetical protein
MVTVFFGDPTTVSGFLEISILLTVNQRDTYYITSLSWDETVSRPEFLFRDPYHADGQVVDDCFK